MYYDVLGINVLSAAMGGIAIYCFCYQNYAIKSSIAKIIIFISTFGILNGLISTFLIESGDLLSIIRPLILLLISIAIIQILLETKIYQSLIAFLIYSLCIGIGNSILPLVINMSAHEFTTENMLVDPYFLLLVNVVSNLIAYFIMFAIKPLRNFISKILVQKTSLPILFITFLVLVTNFGLHIYTKVFSLVSFLITLASSILYCTYLLIVSTKLIKNETSKLEIEQQKFYNESLNSTLFNLRRFKHDWSNNLSVINSMLSMNKINELKQYLSELINQSIEEGNTAIYNIKNAGLFGIVSAKLNHARDMGVTVDFSVIGEVESIPGIKISELCEVIGIFIDNAIEEAAKGEKVIKLSIFSDDSFLEISISNSCTAEPDMKLIYAAGYSSKGEGRGMGLAIARKIIGRYKNIQHLSDYEDNTFTQTITIEKGL